MTDSKFGMSLYTSATTIHEGHAVYLVSTAGYPTKDRFLEGFILSGDLPDLLALGPKPK